MTLLNISTKCGESAMFTPIYFQVHFGFTSDSLLVGVVKVLQGIWNYIVDDFSPQFVCYQGIYFFVNLNFSNRQYSVAMRRTLCSI